MSNVSSTSIIDTEIVDVRLNEHVEIAESLPRCYRRLPTLLLSRLAAPVTRNATCYDPHLP